MTNIPSRPPLPGFLSTVWLLLRFARRRAVGRQRRQNELFRSGARKNAVNWSWLGTVAAVLFMAGLNGGAVYVLAQAFRAGERVDAGRHGKMVVSEGFYRCAGIAPSAPLPETERQSLETSFLREARRIVLNYGGSEKEIRGALRDSVFKNGNRDLVLEKTAMPGLAGLSKSGPTALMLGSLVLFWWGLMLVFQGEGLELDLQRRRHPMWEWLFSHPVPPGAVFMAEMLSPIAANPIYATVPVFAGFLYGIVYGPALGIAAAVTVGIPVAVAAACLGKALEIGVVLRFSPRTRGAVVGLMSWLGYVSMILFFLGAVSISKIGGIAGEFLQPLTVLPWPWLGYFLGASHGSFSFLMGMLTCWGVSGVTIATAVRFSVWGTQRGLSGNFAPAHSAPKPAKAPSASFGKEPLYRKELLWFARDRSAIVQTILIPLTVSGFQLFNLRGLVSHAQGAWNYLCGTGILFGTYFLWILGPKSLASEGAALWIALTWPRGLESLLKAKAWLWSLISSGMVGVILLYAAILFPADAWKVCLVGVGWFFFGRSMAEKTVTLVRVPSSSGEPEKIPRMQQWAASLGMLTFSIGLLTQQWHIAIMGIVYSSLTAAAMWENFRARLPFLYDPWSEQLPPPPTLMHAMIAISILVEGGAVATGIAIAFAGRANIAVVQVVIYGVCAGLVSLGLSEFLRGRGVSAREIWHWEGASPFGFLQRGIRTNRLFCWLLAVLGGVALGLFALAYRWAMLRFPPAGELIRHSREQMANIPGLRISYSLIAICFAPFAEEYLFRGLLFRALDREWGGWRAVLGSAAFFAIYHPALSWLPVGLLGAANALLFKKTGRLAPAVLLHMVYNTMVLSC